MKNDLPENLANPAKRALAGAGINTLEDLTRMKEPEVAKLHGMGPKAVAVIHAALAERNMTFAEEEKR